MKNSNFAIENHKNNMKIGIITAMSSEQKQLANQLRDKTECTKGPFNYIEGTIKNNTIILMQCGIGKVNAAVCTQILIDDFQAEVVINTGIAGSLNADINIGDIVVSTDLVHHDMDAVAFG